ncbi:hypothetical protein B0A54_00485 [Friedmanniomyces endolithicus]|uniref:Acid phosphatase n=1 Tax=Friedmanniomyces endolithicus TaxID=329885 RepID=A0A4U0VGQ7_9PEZI|nr:hypothetical protein B0A54_00485 [Friedmanniomyces endolithicus]
MRRPLSHSIQLPSYKILFLSLLGILTIQTVVSTIMRYSQSTPSLFAGISYLSATVQAQTGYGYPPSPTPSAPSCKGANTTAELIWYPPVKSDVDTLSTVINGTGIYGFPINPYGNSSASTYWEVYTSPSNPLVPEGFNGTCQFPQITGGGLDDSHQHGVDLKAVYSTMLGFIPEQYNANITSYRVTNNVITSQVASMLIAGMYPSRANQDTPLLIQPASIDSLEPAYTCSVASALYGSYGSGSTAPAWLAHLNASASLYATLDRLSGVNPNATDWHMSWDHYFDNLSARLCHAKALPCNIANKTDCVTMAEADEVFRLGEYEYSFIYRDSNQSLPASVASYGIWVAELAQNLRHAMGQGNSSVASGNSIRYRHNVAHDGSVSRLLAILQIEHMVWPGMGAEVIFELYQKDGGCYFLRVLWGGQIMVSSHPALGRLDMLPVETLLGYLDGLVGVGGSKVPGLCKTPECAFDGEGCK